MMSNSSILSLLILYERLIECIRYARVINVLGVWNCEFVCKVCQFVFLFIFVRFMSVVFVTM